MQRGGADGARLTHSDNFNSQTEPTRLSSQIQSFHDIKRRFFTELLGAETARINNAANLSERDKRNQINNLRRPSQEGWELRQRAELRARGTEVGRMLTTAMRGLQSRIAPFEHVYRNAGRYNVAFDKVSVYGEDPNAVRVFTQNGRPVAFQSFTNRGGSERVERISFVGEDCKINRFVTATHRNFSGGTSSAAFDYYGSQICSSGALNQLQRISRDVARDERNPLHNGNEIRFRCEEQGGNSTSGCRCPNGNHINPFAQSCYSNRRPESVTAKDRLENFLNEHGSSGHFPSSDDYDRVREACGHYGQDIAGVQAQSEQNSLAKNLGYRR